ncbi:MAG TPA: hypothetical protein VGQ50_02245 [Actinomycetota bacterium]|nr:hypothetical protein [Actinomycetota bacterium]
MTTFLGGDHRVVPSGPVVRASKKYVCPADPLNPWARTAVLCFQSFHAPLATRYLTSYLQRDPAFVSAHVTANDEDAGLDGAATNMPKTSLGLRPSHVATYVPAPCIVTLFVAPGLTRTPNVPARSDTS